MAKNDRIVTPKGTLKYPWLTKPDTKFNEDGDYKTQLILAREEAEALIEQIDKAMEESHAKAVEENPSKKNLKRADPPYAVDEDTGEVRFSFRTKAQGKRKDGSLYTNTVALVDHKAKKIENPSKLNIGNGTVAKVSARIMPFYTALVGAGVSLQLNAVQLLKVVAYEPDHGFGEEEGEDIDTDAPWDGEDAVNAEGEESEGGEDSGADY